MVVFAASLISKAGKPLVSRQYMDMSRIRIEGLLAAFPKLVGSGKQHTYVETENVRYIYQPMEGLYLLLITNKQSNILEDLDTLRLLSKIVPEFATSFDEDDIVTFAFEIVAAFDEVISLGYKENISVMQVKQNCEMESHEEKLHKMIIQSKINDTKDLMKKKAQEIDKNKLEQKVKSGYGSMASFSSGKPMAPSAVEETRYSRPEPVPTPVSKPAAAKGPSKGMQLGKSKKGNDILESLAKEGEAVELVFRPAAAGGLAATAILSSDPVTLIIDEKLSVLLDRQGGCENVEVIGTMSLTVNSEADACIRIGISSGVNTNFQFKTHPNIDKTQYSNNNMLCLKDPSKPFPVGSELGVLKWRMQSKDQSLVPITINCWPSVSGVQTYVNIEYESTSDFDLQNVSIVIPLPGSSTDPSVNQVDGDWCFDLKRGAVVWTIDLVDDSNRTGSMEFVVSAADAESFFPVEVSFTSSKIYCDVAVDSVMYTVKEGAAKYTFKKFLTTGEYIVQ
ncbi:hypothetical protein CEUSTIGMA_g11139.t1 [Chlamydomonas eustigma]|uniref:Coatomer subunit delta n=1 Tax=Chlamydomonas eustigma TaxID=1157962 RepID=A0A250XKV8_9CHLO|nr:hypothetical protein CEUSTIGMA_g11139.t1 [Chlamydomonas eustigma]|eukprot:GAX83714.1 hypothetical protein CEUSTIGMA_g11139.t1 [Chlamydomonas eustigma]